jgi:pyruvate/2-oxoglutarate dehydrogenase complex dihydrolipoamide dehydrogenase (E3) component
VLGRVTRMTDAEAAIAAGVCDVVGSARELIAEPQFVRHAREGTEALGRTCIACNWCLGGMAYGVFGCSINPASYRERIWGVDTFALAAKPSKVVVVGGGPGGLEAARVAALKGHEVTLFEARDTLGGALALWAKLPSREFYANAIDWWARELHRLGITVRTGRRVAADEVLALAPDAVIVATGGEFSPTGRAGCADRDIPGADLAHVCTPEDVLLGRASPSGKIVLLDGEGTQASSGIAEMLGRSGAEVTMVSANYAPYSNQQLMGFEGEPIARRLADANVVHMPATWAISIGERDVRLYGVENGRESRLDGIDAVVLATGRRSIDELSAALDGKVAQLFTIGDALSIRPMATAAYEGQKFARLIGEPDAARSIAEAFFAPDDPAIYPAPAA